MDVGTGRGSHCLPGALSGALKSPASFAALPGVAFTLRLLPLISAMAPQVVIITPILQVRKLRPRVAEPGHGAGKWRIEGEIHLHLTLKPVLFLLYHPIFLDGTGTPCFVVLQGCYVSLQIESKTLHQHKDYNSLYCDTCFAAVVWN